MATDIGPHLSTVIKRPELCYGCRTCELACSFHHQGSFSPEKSSIKILRSNETGEIKWQFDATCDSCLEEAEPFCVKYCMYGALDMRKRS